MPELPDQLHYFGTFCLHFVAIRIFSSNHHMIKQKQNNLTDFFLCENEIVSLKSLKMSSTQFLDDLVREYLLYRGFVTSLKAFDAEIKAEKEKGLRSDK